MIETRAKLSRLTLMPQCVHRLTCVAAALGLVIALPAVAGVPTYVVTDIGLLPGRADSRALGLNEYGQVVGFSYNFTINGKT